MRFPKTVQFRKAEARIYGRTKNYPFNRVAGYVVGKRRVANHGEEMTAPRASSRRI